MELSSPDAQLRIDLAAGGRLASLRVFGHELLVTNAAHLLHWGSYPMAPWAGRLRHGRFVHQGQSFQLPPTLPPHAIHGTVWGRPWTQIDEHEIAITLGDTWPYPGQARQRFTLNGDGLVMELSVHATEGSFPASIGWHPYFLRDLGTGEAARLDFSAAAIYVDDHEQIPTGDLATPPPGPWDNCFTNIRRAPRLCWPGVMEVTLESDLDHWVVYDLLDHAICVEPMSGPPNALNLAPRIVTTESPLTGRFELRWARHTDHPENQRE